MRKVIVYNFVSLDGFYSGPDSDGSELWPMMRDVFLSYNAELLRDADYFLIGRHSHDIFHEYWPEVSENPDSDKWTPEEKELTKAGTDVEEIVISDSLAPSDTRSTILRRNEAHARIRELKSQAGKSILITGSRTMWNDLLANGLIDEIHVMFANQLLGKGIPLFIHDPGNSLRLEEVRRWEGVDNFLVRYSVDGAEKFHS